MTPCFPSGTREVEARGGSELKKLCVTSVQPYLPRSDPRVLQPISQDLDRPRTYFKGSQKVEGWSEEAATYPGMNQAPSGKVSTKAHPSS